MRKSLSIAQYLLLALLLFALTACGTTVAQNAAPGTIPSATGKITAKLVYPKTAAKSVALPGDNVTRVRLMVTGATTPTAKKDFAPLDVKNLECYPGTKLTVTAYAYNASNVLVYEGITTNVTVEPAKMVDNPADVNGPDILAGTPVTVQLSAPVVKTVNLPCLACHEGTRDTDGQNLVSNYKQSGHYLNDTNASFTPVAGTTPQADNSDHMAGCAGCHGDKHQDRNPAENGRCAVCHVTGVGGTTAASINANHGPQAGGALGYASAGLNNCNLCHVSHNYKGKSGCIGCHAVGQNANDGVTNAYVNDNNGVRAVTGEFSKWSHHVTGVNIDNAHCAACHLEGKVANNSIAVDTKFHMVDNKVHLRDADTDEDIQWNPAEPSFSNIDNFCLSCHDSNGATSPGSLLVQTYLKGKPSIQAVGKTASPSNPFGDTISNQYDKLQRPAVVDAKSQFNTSNPSHHAVLGKRYTGRTRTGSVRAVASTFASNSSATLPGIRTTIYDAGKFESAYTTLADADGELSPRMGGQSLGDDSTLHCADCHTVGQYSPIAPGYGGRYNQAVIGAHGSNNEYLLRNNAGTDEKHYGTKFAGTGGFGAAKGVDANGNLTGTEAYLVCYNCHTFKTYGSTYGSNGWPSVGSPTLIVTARPYAGSHGGEYANAERCNGPYNTNGVELTGEARLESIKTNDAFGTQSGSTFSNYQGIQCSNCHNSGISAGNIFGGIHGAKQTTYTDGMGNTTKSYRFFPGLGNTMFVPGTKGGFTGGTKAIYAQYSGNRNGTGTGNLTGQTYTQLPVRAIVPGTARINGSTTALTLTRGSYEYTTGGTSNDLNWEQQTQQTISGEFDYQAKAAGCYTLSPTGSVKSLVATGAGAAGTYPATVAATDAQKGPDGREMFDNWGGCDDHNGAQAAGTGIVRKTLRKVTY